MFIRTTALLVAHLYACCLFSQGSINGTLSDWTYGSAEVYTGLMAPMNVGTINDMGSFEIQLKPDFLSEIQKQMDEQNANPDRKWSSSLMSISDSFSCPGEEVTVENGDQPITALSTMGAFTLASMEKQQRFGYLVPASSADFVEGMMELGSYKFSTGYSLDWYYVESAGSVKGTCAMDSYAVNQEEMYTNTTEFDLTLQPGWNLIQYEIEEVFTDRDGKSYPQKVRYTTLESLPEDLQYVFVDSPR